MKLIDRIRRSNPLFKTNPLFKRKRLKLYPILCQYGSHSDMQTMIQVAYFLPFLEGSGSLHFHPGSTGFESYSLDTVEHLLASSKESFKPAKMVFGSMTTWEASPWLLCAGGGNYKRLSICCGEMEELIMQIKEDFGLNNKEEQCK